jgi:hypothetical protein
MAVISAVASAWIRSARCGPGVEDIARTITRCRPTAMASPNQTQAGQK